MTSSTKSGAKGAVQLMDDTCGDGSITARYLQPGGMWKMAIGTTLRDNNQYEGKLTQLYVNNQQGGSWGYCNGV